MFISSSDPLKSALLSCFYDPANRYLMDSYFVHYFCTLTAISFLIETGTVLHFSDTSHGLCKLYFLDAVWLAECLERIVHLKSSRSVAHNGLIRTEDLRMLLIGTGFTQHTEEQYFQFLAKFEIALPVASNRLVSMSS